MLVAEQTPTRQDPLIRIASDIDYAPLSFVDMGDLSGFDIELIAFLSSSNHFNFVHHLDTWSLVLEGLASGRFDVVTGILATPERREIFDFSIPYLVDRYAIFTRGNSSIRNSTDLPGLQAAVLNEDAVIENYLVPHGLDGEIIRTDTFTESLVLVHEGIADYTIAPMSLGVHISRELYLGLRYTGRELFSVEYRLAVRKGEPELLALLNDSIMDMHIRGDLQQLKDNWSFYTPLAVSSPDPTSPVTAVIAVLACLIIASMFIVFRLLHKRVERREQNLLRINSFLASVLDAVPLALWWKNADLQYEGCSIAFLELMNLTYRDEIVGKTDAEVFAGEDASLREEQDKYVLKEGLSNYHHEDQGLIRSVLRNSSNEIIGIVAGFGQTASTLKLRSTIRSLTAQLAEKESLLQQQSLIDAETGLFRTGFVNIRLHEEIEMYKRYGQTFTLIFLNIFPDAANVCAEAFRCASELLRNHIRQVDVPGIYSDHILYILLPHTGASEAGDTAHKLRMLFKEELMLLHVAVSISEYHGGSESDFLAEAVQKINHASKRSLV